MSKPRTPRGRSLVALVDLDGTVANYTKAVIEGLELLRGPEEEVILPAFGKEPPHIKNRVNLDLMTGSIYTYAYEKIIDEYAKVYGSENISNA